jgi:hypothetical protein
MMMKNSNGPIIELNETPSKGVMMWGILTNDYNNLTRATVVIFQEWLHLVEVLLHRLMGYAESHDEERLCIIICNRVIVPLLLMM